MKRNACQARARNLRLWVHPSPSSDNGNSSVRCVNVTYFDSFFSPVGGSPSRALQCSTPSSSPPRYASAQMQSQVRRTQSTNSAFSNKSPAGMCIPLGYKPRGYNSFGLSSLKIPRVVLSVSPGRYLTFFCLVYLELITVWLARNTVKVLIPIPFTLFSVFQSKKRKSYCGSRDKETILLSTRNSNKHRHHT